MIEREPFQPLKVSLASGENLEITNPRLVVPMSNQFFIALPDDRYKLIWLRHVVSVETIRAA